MEEATRCSASANEMCRNRDTGEKGTSLRLAGRSQSETAEGSSETAKKAAARTG